MASLFALISLLGVAILALFPEPHLLPPDALLPEKAALFFLLAAFCVALVPSLHRRLVEDRDAATFALLAAFFVLFHLAERVGPRSENPGRFFLHFAILPDKIPISYALRLVVLGTVLSVPSWWKGGGPQRFVWAALGLVGLLGAATFWFLGHFFEVGPTAILDPTPLPAFFLQILGYGALGALCRAATESPATRRVALRVVPLLLGIILIKYQAFPAPVPAEDAE